MKATVARREVPPVADRGVPAAMLQEGVIRNVLWFYGLEGGQQPGSFTDALLATFQRADRENFARLRSVYPIAAFWMYALRFTTDGHKLAARALEQIEAAR